MTGDDGQWPGRAESYYARRAQAWRRIQGEYPDLAKLLQEVNEHFRRPAYMEFRIGDERLWPPPEDLEVWTEKD